MRGLPGSGKSTVAKIINKKILNSELLRTDRVRKEEYKKEDITYSDEQRLEVYEKMARRGRNLLSHGIRVIYDCTCEKKEYLNALLKNLPEEASVHIIEVICNEGILIDRLRIRSEKKGNELSDAGIDQYYQIKKSYESLENDFKIDTSGTEDETKQIVESFLYEALKI